MNDLTAKLFAGHAGVCAVLVDVLIDKGVISQSTARAQAFGQLVAASRAALPGTSDAADSLS